MKEIAGLQVKQFIARCKEQMNITVTIPASVKTFSDITKLERNGMFVYESVPGTAVEKFNCTSDSVSFTVEGKEDAMITLELEPETSYDITVNGASAGQMKTNLGGKLNLSVELDPGVAVTVQVSRV